MNLMHLTIATIIPIIIAGISNNPIPRGINARITVKPIIDPRIVNITFSSTTPTLKAAIMKTKNTNKPINISISSPFQINIFKLDFFYIILLSYSVNYILHKIH